jgi:hypothetical protein
VFRAKRGCSSNADALSGEMMHADSAGGAPPTGPSDALIAIVFALFWIGLGVAFLLDRHPNPGPKPIPSGIDLEIEFGIFLVYMAATVIGVLWFVYDWLRKRRPR